MCVCVCVCVTLRNADPKNHLPNNGENDATHVRGILSSLRAASSSMRQPAKAQSLHCEDMAGITITFISRTLIQTFHS